MDYVHNKQQKFTQNLNFSFLDQNYDKALEVRAHAYTRIHISLFDHLQGRVKLREIIVNDQVKEWKEQQIFCNVF